MGLWSTIGTVVGGAAGAFIGQPQLGASLGSSLGGIADSEVEKKKAEEEKRRLEQEQAIKMREQIAAQYNSQSNVKGGSVNMEGPKTQNKGPDTFDYLQKAAQGAVDLYAKLSKDSGSGGGQQTPTQPPQKDSVDQAVDKAFDQQTGYNQNMPAPPSVNMPFGSFMNPNVTPNPTGQMDIYGAILRNMKGGY